MTPTWSSSFSSYKSNPQLLQRSEVVALFNTAHRFTESLHFVDEFRRLWAIAENREVIIKNVEENINVSIICCFHESLTGSIEAPSRRKTATAVTSRRASRPATKNTCIRFIIRSLRLHCPIVQGRLAGVCTDDCFLHYLLYAGCRQCIHTFWKGWITTRRFLGQTSRRYVVNRCIIYTYVSLPLNIGAQSTRLIVDITLRSQVSW